MTQPFEGFLIELPDDMDPTEVENLEQQFAQIDGVEECSESSTRGLDAASIAMYVTLASTIVTTIGAAVGVIKQVTELLKSKGIKGAKLTLADGRVLQADEISAEDFVKLSNSLEAP